MNTKIGKELKLKVKIQKIIWKNDTDFSKKIVSLSIIKNKTDFFYSNKVIAKDYLGLLKEHYTYDIIAFFTNENFDTIKIEGATISMPNSEKKLIDFFSSNLFPGIGKNSAKIIVEELKISTIENLLEKYFEIVTLIGHKKASIIKNIIENNYFDYEIYHFFTINDLPNSLLNKFNKHYGKWKLIDKIKANPYKIIYFDPSINLFLLNKIQKILNLQIDQREIYKSSIFSLIYEYMLENGSTYIYINKLYLAFLRKNNLVDFSKSIFFDLLKDLNNLEFINLFFINQKMYIINQKIKNKEIFIYEFLSELKNLEVNLSFKLDSILKSKIFDVKQKDAIIAALNNHITIITGIPGSGKSTLIHEIYKKLLTQYKKTEINILTPTGKATVILKEKTKNVKTIHSFLKWNKENNVFELNALNPSNSKVVIIDEFSMVDINVFASLLEAIPKIEKLILVGDFNQLPSIREGQILKDLINSHFINPIYLEKNYRQKNSFSILENALRIKENKLPILNSEITNFIESSSKNYINNLIQYLENFIKLHKTKDYYDILKDLNILSIKYEGFGGINEINQKVQHFFHHIFLKNKKPFYIKDNIKLYLADKVIQVENDIEKDVYNGEIGFIFEVKFMNNNEIKNIIVNFNGKKILYTLGSFLKSTKLAYAISVHKFQGSSSNHILFLPFLNQRRLLSKRLIYTAFSRAKNSLFIIGEYDAFKIAISKENNKNRNTYLNLLLFNKIL